VTAESAAAWQLELVGPRRRRMSRAALLALPRSEQTLTIACVEGWSTTQTWTGVPLAALARLAGAPAGSALRAV
jgi:DMSO/TMAO reductase YedYZ molybdopterin-dependent catalytic subunit